jgi:hypothetical protein
VYTVYINYIAHSRRNTTGIDNACHPVWGLNMELASSIKTRLPESPSNGEATVHRGEGGGGRRRRRSGGGQCWV